LIVKRIGNYLAYQGELHRYGYGEIPILGEKLIYLYYCPYRRYLGEQVDPYHC